MKRLTFVYRSDSNPHPFQERRARFLLNGSIEVQQTTTLVRPLTFAYPGSKTRTNLIQIGAYGLRPLNFRLGRVSFGRRGPTLLLGRDAGAVQFLKGRITLATTLTGALTDFAIFGLAQEDPQDFYVESATNLTSGGVQQPYVRMNAVFVPHRRARYIGVGAKVYAMPNTGQWRNHYFKKWMLEKAPIGVATPAPGYSPAREVKVTMRPHRTLSPVEIAEQTPVVQRILEDNVPLGIGIADPTWVNP